MTSEKQVDANRRNAQSSTGPRTEEGKAASRMNALKHGLTAAEWVLPTEDEEEHARFRNALVRELAPVGALETELAEEIAGLTWRLRRGERLELGIFAEGISTTDEQFYLKQREKFQVTEAAVRKYQLAQLNLNPDQVLEITNPHQHEYLTNLSEAAAAVRRTDEVRLASAFVDDAAGPGAFAKLTRYETNLFRRRNQALEILHSHQAARKNAEREDVA